VVVLDGDGNILMNLGSLATIGNLAPKNVIHIVLDNECYESTGGQPTVSATAKLEKTAEASGYKAAKRVEDKETLKEAVAQLLDTAGPSFVLVKTGREREDVPRVPYEPEKITTRFKAAVQ
jgi:thiamine pyrophosphate-dependent acetolactate synthase large subunit-like protein